MKFKKTIGLILFLLLTFMFLGLSFSLQRRWIFYGYILLVPTMGAVFLIMKGEIFMKIKPKREEIVDLNREKKALDEKTIKQISQPKNNIIRPSVDPLKVEGERLFEIKKEEPKIEIVDIAEPSIEDEAQQTKQDYKEQILLDEIKELKEKLEKKKDELLKLLGV